MLDRPIFIVGNARSGTTLMRSYLEQCPTLFRLGRESRFLWDRFVHPFDDARGSLRGAQRDASRIGDLESARALVTREYLRHCYLPETVATDDDDALAFVQRLEAQGANPWYYELPRSILIDRFGEPPFGPPFSYETGETAPFTVEVKGRRPREGERIRLLDKDTGHTYRVPLLAALFPDAIFVFVVRSAFTAVSSLLEAWLHPRWFFSYRMPVPLHIPGYSELFPWGPKWWNLNLPPDWPDLIDLPLEDVCARIWASGSEHLKAGYEACERSVWVRYEDLAQDPSMVLKEISRVADIDLGLPEGYRHPPVVTEDTPSPDRWLRNRERVLRAAPHFQAVQARLGYPVTP